MIPQSVWVLFGDECNDCGRKDLLIIYSSYEQALLGKQQFIRDNPREALRYFLEIIEYPIDAEKEWEQ